MIREDRSIIHLNWIKNIWTLRLNLLRYILYLDYTDISDLCKYTERGGGGDIGADFQTIRETQLHVSYHFPGH